MLELASDSTLFLDKIGEMPLTIQVKLLRVLRDRIADLPIIVNTLINKIKEYQLEQ